VRIGRRSSLAIDQSPLTTVLNMEIPHFIAMLLFALLVSVAFAVFSKDTPRDQFIYGAKVFGSFVGVAVVLGWLMYFLPPR